MKTRIFSGIAFGIIMISGIWYSEWTYFILFGLITCLGLYEFYTLINTQEAHVSKTAGIIYGLLVYVAFFNYSKNSNSLSHFPTFPLSHFLTFTFWLFPLFAILELFRKKNGSFRNFIWMVGGIIYLAGGFSSLHFIAFESGSYSPYVVLGFIFLQWSNDTFSYFSGVLFGKHKLFERISPKKTWEGSFGGALITIIIAVVLSKYVTLYSMVDWIIIAILVIVFGTFGDLCESMLKRNIRIKDSGAIIPGHGGILDRFDGLLFSAPAVAVYLNIIKGL